MALENTDMAEAAPEEMDSEMQEVASPPVRDVLMAALEIQNLAETLDDQTLATLSDRVLSDYHADKRSCDEWSKKVEKATKLAMSIAEQKDYPFKGASNVKYPLLSEAALQFNARAYPAIVQSGDIVKCKTYGADPDGRKVKRAARVQEYQSYQLCSEMPEWEDDTDKLTVVLPITGCMFRKVYRDPAKRRNASRLVWPNRLVVNYRAQSMDNVPRLTEEIDLYPHEIEKRIRSGHFMEFPYRDTAAESDATENEESQPTPDDPHMFLEQNRLYDLDGDGYPEPYIVTVHKQTAKVVRVVANFDPETAHFSENGDVISLERNAYFVKYDFLPNPEGGFYGMGFGWLLNDLGETINTTINQLMDAGHLANVQGGLVSASLGIKERSISIGPGEWKVIKTNGDLAGAIFPINYKEPSAVLFQLLGMFIEAGRDLSAIKDVLTGETRQNQTATTTLALIEQGLMVFTAIYKRVYRSLKKELSILARLNRDFGDDQTYNAFFDGPEQFSIREDFDMKGMDIAPVADPNSVSKMQKLAKAQFVYEAAQNNPLVNPVEATKRMFEAAQVDDIDKLIVPPPQPDPEEEILKRIMAELHIEAAQADIVETKAKALKAIADAEAAEEGQQLAAYTAYLGAVQNILSARMGNGQGRPGGMEGAPGDQSGAPAPGPQGGGIGTGNQGQPLPLPANSSAGLDQPAVSGGL